VPMLWSCGQHPYSSLSDDASLTSRQSIGLNRPGFAGGQLV
jgi:hypothetical protein